MIDILDILELAPPYSFGAAPSSAATEGAGSRYRPIPRRRPRSDPDDELEEIAAVAMAVVMAGLLE